jgi:hypothetical protein
MARLTRNRITGGGHIHNAIFEQRHPGVRIHNRAYLRQFDGVWVFNWRSEHAIVRRLITSRWCGHG